MKTKAEPKPKKPHKQLDEVKLILRSLGLEYAEEHRFHPVRMWRFDLAVPSIKMAIEYHGHSGFVGKTGASGHSSIKGLTNDCQKMSEAQILGWRVLAFTALHFRESERVAHKLKSPIAMITDMVERLEIDGRTRNL